MWAGLLPSSVGQAGHNVLAYAGAVGHGCSHSVEAGASCAWCHRHQRPRGVCRRNSGLLQSRGQGKRTLRCSATRSPTPTRCGTASAPQASGTASMPELAVPRGDTAGAAFLLDSVTVQAGDRDLLVDVDWQAMPGHRVGLVGANGCGKSTLLRCLCGQRNVNSGCLVVGPNVEVGYLEQTAVSGSDRPVWEEVRSRMTALVAAEAAIEAATQAAARGEPQAPEALQLAQDQFCAAGGYDSDKRIANVLTGLGFKQSDWSKLCSEFSGGWQMRIALARLLLGPAGQCAASGESTGILFLDEPTNHLDRAACKWLGSFLKSSSGGVVIVSHDAELLDSACDRIVEVRGRKLHHYVGGYAKFLEQRALREAQERATAEAQQAEIARLETFVTRFGAKATKASQAQSRAKQLEKLREAATPLPAASSGAGPGDAKKVALRLPKAPPCDEVVLQLKGASIGWGSRVDGQDPLLTGVDLTVKRGQRILVLGPNGAGKSTLLKALSGAMELWEGTRELGDRVKLAVFSQDLAQDLPLGRPALEYVLDVAREDDITVTMERGRQALGALGLSGSMALREIGALSGGEKARVALAAFALVPSNLLLLDEASNHLDAGTIATLTSSLQEYNGALVAITHNPAFARSLEATHVLRVRDGRVALAPHYGLTAADFDHSAPPAPIAAAGTAPSPGAAAARKAKPAMRAGRGSLAAALHGALAAEQAEDPHADVRASGNGEVERSAPPSRFERMKAKKDAAKAEKAAKVERKKRRG